MHVLLSNLPKQPRHDIAPGGHVVGSHLHERKRYVPYNNMPPTKTRLSMTVAAPRYVLHLGEDMDNSHYHLPKLYDCDLL